MQASQQAHEQHAEPHRAAGERDRIAEALAEGYRHQSRYQVADQERPGLGQCTG